MGLGESNLSKLKKIAKSINISNSKINSPTTSNNPNQLFRDIIDKSIDGNYTNEQILKLKDSEESTENNEYKRRISDYKNTNIFDDCNYAEFSRLLLEED